ncbi:hypothetical protein CEUSTIGMA_g11092.t1 [Chlamydomonas eustigma]|uniref:Myosin motor domain-containing protein n=1 Tax=Chlamydomonas eustigma TaxID=1157962 RepID=A0A250XKS9_9CHLO|nr:hypothetical protein CEUSTIGMA_g11092.t1 [Chlamydomonas eustigma]|eukprot:GAX83667.1 hypothetical protein CEUSTIGMA_g11092.t1 [Chlamydomonas eustigma]
MQSLSGHRVNPAGDVQSMAASTTADAAPHVYSVACHAYRQMRREKAGQAILITGESGAGKTETSKMIMNCLAQLSHNGNKLGGGGLGCCTPSARLEAVEKSAEASHEAAAASCIVRDSSRTIGDDDCRSCAADHHQSDICMTSTAGSTISLEQRVLQCNPLLEAFGNAKTTRNNNSSRFGKYIEMYFSEPDASLIGTAIRTYLLERSRVVQVNDKERSYHIFYQLCAGASPEERIRWSLGPASSFRVLRSSDCIGLVDVDDGSEFKATREAMRCFEIGPEEQDQVFQVVSAILHLGNVTFMGHDGDGCDACALGDDVAAAHIKVASVLLGLQQQQLADILVIRQLKTSEGCITVPLKAHQAEESRNALCKVLYASLFDWLVERINSSLRGENSGHDSFTVCSPPDTAQPCLSALHDDFIMHCRKNGSGGKQTAYAAVSAAAAAAAGNSSTSDLLDLPSNNIVSPVPLMKPHCTAAHSSSASQLSIGLLDIYGFESFHFNDLEQLCINLANEKLQQHFNQHVFKWEQAEYVREGIDWRQIAFEDNSDVLDLIEGRLGLMTVLDEQGRLPKCSAEDLAFRISASPAIRDSSRFSRPKGGSSRASTSFQVQHYAGPVVYGTENLIAKNKEQVPSDQRDLLASSSLPLLRSLFSSRSSTATSDTRRTSSTSNGMHGTDDASPLVDQNQMMKHRLQPLMSSGHYGKDQSITTTTRPCSVINHDDELMMRDVQISMDGDQAAGSHDRSLSQHLGYESVIEREVFKASGDVGPAGPASLTAGVTGDRAALSLAPRRSTTTALPSPRHTSLLSSSIRPVDPSETRYRLKPEPRGASVIGGGAHNPELPHRIPTKSMISSQQLPLQGSIVIQFRRQLGELMSKLQAVQPHYVRCIKPNAYSAPGVFDQAYVLQQLKCGGIMEAVRVCCAGYSYKQPYLSFLDHFWPICPPAWHGVRKALYQQSHQHIQQAGDDWQVLGALPDVAVSVAEVSDKTLVKTKLHEAVQDVLSASAEAGCAVTEGSYQLGSTKLFMKGSVVDALDRLRTAKIHTAATAVQAAVRGFRARRLFLEVKEAALVLQTAMRACQARCFALQLRREKAAEVIQSAWRCMAARRRLVTARAAACVLQALWRRRTARQDLYTARREYAASRLQAVWRSRKMRLEFVHHLRLSRAAAVIQRVFRAGRKGEQLRQVFREVVVQAVAMETASRLLQCMWRAKAARKELAQRKAQESRQRFLSRIQMFQGGQRQQTSGAVLLPMPAVRQQQQRKQQQIHLRSQPALSAAAAVHPFSGAMSEVSSVGNNSCLHSNSKREIMGMDLCDTTTACRGSSSCFCDDNNDEADVVKPSVACLANPSEKGGGNLSNREYRELPTAHQTAPNISSKKEGQAVENGNDASRHDGQQIQHGCPQLLMQSAGDTWEEVMTSQSGLPREDHNEYYETSSAPSCHYQQLQTNHKKECQVMLQGFRLSPLLQMWQQRAEASSSLNNGARKRR